MCEFTHGLAQGHVCWGTHGISSAMGSMPVTSLPCPVRLKGLLRANGALSAGLALGAPSADWGPVCNQGQVLQYTERAMQGERSQSWYGVTLIDFGVVFIPSHAGNQSTLCTSPVPAAALFK